MESDHGISVPEVPMAPPSTPTTSSGRIALDGGPGTAARARRAVRAFMDPRAGAIRASAGTVELIVSELVTNAVRHAPGPCVLEIEDVDGEVRVTVHDTSPEHPVRRAGDAYRPSGHGLELVRSLSTHLLVVDHHDGKAVTARIRYADGPR
ncbi:ATP-binding protein [Embleya sp. NPDC050493]|uniref:ATP-binding protein n=1 Tax=Embleya sp. NPDC050493 TaxID=3363989 RepID=UPI00379A64C7